MISRPRTRTSCRLELEPLEDRRVPATLYGLTSNNILLRFDSASPGTIADAEFVSGLHAGERLVGMDFRPRTGQLFGVGIVSGATDTVRLYTINALTGAATQVPGSTSFTVTSGNSYGVDFNPTTDRLRVVNDGDENFRINPNNGARADTPTNDTDINSAGRQIEGIAYDRNFDTGFAVANRTTLYGISVTNSTLVTVGGINQSPSPNGGRCKTPYLSASRCPPRASRLRHPGRQRHGFATLRNNATGLTGLYSINLSTGAATLVGSVGNGATTITGLPRRRAKRSSPGPAPVPWPASRSSTADRRARDSASRPTGVSRAASAWPRPTLPRRHPDIIVALGPGARLPRRVFNGSTGHRSRCHRQLLPLRDEFPGRHQRRRRGRQRRWVQGRDRRAMRGRRESGVQRRQWDRTVELPGLRSSFSGGVRVAATDFDRDGRYEIVAATGPGAQAHVKVFDSTGNLFTSASLPNFKNDFFPYGTQTFGVYVAAGDVNGDGVPDIVTGAGAGAPPRVRAFSGVNGALTANFLVYGGSFTGGVRVALADRNADGRYDIRIAPGSGRLTSIQTFDAVTLQLLDSFLAYGTGFTGGAFVGGTRS